MNRNQKIALGCGGAGCLGLIVVVIAGGLIYYFASRSSTNRSYRNLNVNVSTNRNSNSNDNSDFSANTNHNSSNSSNSSSTSSLSEDDKHKLYQAAGMTGDAELLRRVTIKIGLMDEDYTPGENYQSFLYDHIEWAQRNVDFITSLNTAEKARAYIQQNLPN